MWLLRRENRPYCSLDCACTHFEVALAEPIVPFGDSIVRAAHRTVLLGSLVARPRAGPALVPPTRGAKQASATAILQRVSRWSCQSCTVRRPLLVPRLRARRRQLPASFSPQRPQDNHPERLNGWFSSTSAFFFSRFLLCTFLPPKVSHQSSQSSFSSSKLSHNFRLCQLIPLLPFLYIPPLAHPR